MADALKRLSICATNSYASASSFYSSSWRLLPLRYCQDQSQAKSSELDLTLTYSPSASGDLHLTAPSSSYKSRDVVDPLPIATTTTGGESMSSRCQEQQTSSWNWATSFSGLFPTRALEAREINALAPTFS